MSNLYPDLYRTTFPEQIDTFTKFLDILATDGDLVKQYQEAMANGNQVLANSVLAKIPNYQQKIVTAQDMNKFLDAVVAVERFYKTDIEPYLDVKQSEWQDILNEFTYIGDYTYVRSYKRNNYVTYGVGTAIFLYVALKDVPQGVEPNNTEYWRVLSIRGERGERGNGVSFNGEWDASAPYIKDNCVEFRGDLWVSLQPNQGQEPSTTSEYWLLLYHPVNTVYPVTPTQPPVQQEGEIWFKVI